MATSPEQITFQPDRRFDVLKEQVACDSSSILNQIQFETATSNGEGNDISYQSTQIRVQAYSNAKVDLRSTCLVIDVAFTNAAMTGDKTAYSVTPWCLPFYLLRQISLHLNGTPTAVFQSSSQDYYYLECISRLFSRYDYTTLQHLDNVLATPINVDDYISTACTLPAASAAQVALREARLGSTNYLSTKRLVIPLSLLFPITEVNAVMSGVRSYDIRINWRHSDEILSPYYGADGHMPALNDRCLIRRVQVLSNLAFTSSIQTSEISSEKSAGEVDTVPFINTECRDVSITQGLQFNYLTIYNLDKLFVFNPARGCPVTVGIVTGILTAPDQFLFGNNGTQTFATAADMAPELWTNCFNSIQIKLGDQLYPQRVLETAQIIDPVTGVNVLWPNQLFYHYELALHKEASTCSLPAVVLTDFSKTMRFVCLRMWYSYLPRAGFSPKDLLVRFTGGQSLPSGVLKAVFVLHRLNIVSVSADGSVVKVAD